MSLVWFVNIKSMRSLNVNRILKPVTFFIRAIETVVNDFYVRIFCVS